MVGVVLNIKEMKYPVDISFLLYWFENYHLYTPNSHFAKNGLVLRMLLIIKQRPIIMTDISNPMVSSNVVLLHSDNICPICGMYGSRK